MKGKLYKVEDKVPQTGRCQCIVCGLILEFLPQHIEKNAVFNSCPPCFAGTENGPKKPDKDIWKFIS